MTDNEQPNLPPEERPALPPTPPPQVAPGFAPSAPGRPVAATVIAIVLLVFAVLGLTAFIPQPIQVLPSVVRAVSLVISAISIALYITMGVGLLRMEPWARKGTIYTLIGLFIVGMATSALTYTYTAAYMQQQIAATPSPEAAIGARVGMMIGLG
ncbi:MAG TPA: hypothetical protein PK794_03850, partial [Armatimonadota bacterium]|nr:hypothetical protein [Armatimonadota bacterium]